MIILGFNTYEEAVEAERQISHNCDLPQDGTIRWDQIGKLVGQEIWCVQCPNESGFRSKDAQISYEEMMANVGGQIVETDLEITYLD